MHWAALLYFDTDLAARRQHDVTLGAVEFLAYLTNAIVIIVCGCAGAYAAWAVVSAIGWSGVGAGVAMVIVAMVLAALLYFISVAVGRVLHLLK